MKRLLLVVVLVGASGCAPAPAAPRDGGAEGEGEGEASCASLAAFASPASDGRFETVASVFIRDTVGTCQPGRTAAEFLFGVQGNYRWSSPCPDGHSSTCPSRAQVQLKIDGFGLGACPSDLVTFNGAAQDCVPPEHCDVICPVCIQSIPSNAAAQIVDDVGHSDARCVDMTHFR